MIFWHAALVGWIVCWKQGVEKTMKFASAYGTNVANLYKLIRGSSEDQSRDSSHSTAFMQTNAKQPPTNVPLFRTPLAPPTSAST